MDLKEYEKMFPHAQVDGMLFYTPNSHTKWRVDTLYTKEPDTIEWLKGMKPGEVLYDVGANIGLYSIFAAKRGVRVCAFEPESQNFAVLIKNIAINRLEHCEAYPLCLGERLAIDTLRLSCLTAGGSCHSFGEDMDYHGNEKTFAADQGSVSVSMNDFVYLSKKPLPDYIKIDVDGFEHYVLSGASDCILNAKSILCEMDSNRKEHVCWSERLCKDHGFHTDEAQIKAARRSEGPFTGIGNIIFYR